MNYKSKLCALALGIMMTVGTVGPSVAASGTPVIDGNLLPAGYVQDADFATAMSLTVPTQARLVLIQAEGDNLRWRDDGTAPDATTGMLLEAGQTLVYNGCLGCIQIIEVSTSSIVNITFYR